MSNVSSLAGLLAVSLAIDMSDCDDDVVDV